MVATPVTAGTVRDRSAPPGISGLDTACRSPHASHAAIHRWRLTLIPLADTAKQHTIFVISQPPPGLPDEGYIAARGQAGLIQTCIHNWKSNW